MGILEDQEVRDAGLWTNHLETKRIFSLLQVTLVSNPMMSKPILAGLAVLDRARDMKWYGSTIDLGDCMQHEYKTLIDAQVILRCCFNCKTFMTPNEVGRCSCKNKHIVVCRPVARQQIPEAHRWTNFKAVFFTRSVRHLLDVTVKELL
jgi:hypothetical protein